MDSGGTLIVALRRTTMDLDKDLRLTRSERKLLATLLASPGQVISRRELMALCLGNDALVLDRTIDVHICALRRKLGERGNMIETVRARGYRWKEAPEEPKEMDD